MITEQIIETSLTLDYRKTHWGLERIVLDAVSNHLPDDSKGTTVSVKLKQDGILYDIHDANQTKEVEQIVIEDNGTGYNYRLLSVLFSTKSADALSVGQFGEGLKKVAAAALRENVDIEYQSQNWFASPRKKYEVIDGKGIQRLCFQVIENGHNKEGSRTVINQPSKRMLEEIFQIPQKVLALNREYQVLYQINPQTQIINLNEPAKISPKTETQTKAKTEAKTEFEIEVEGGAPYGDYRENKTLFVKGVKVNRINALFDYNLAINDITPDRIYVQKDIVLDNINRLLRNCTNYDIIKAILTEARTTPYSSKYEIQSFRNNKHNNSIHAVDGEELERNLLDPNPLTTINLKNKAPIIGVYIKTDLRELTNLDFFIDYALNNRTSTSAKYLHWAQAFRELYGEKAVLASADNSLLNTEVTSRGYTPIQLNSGIAKFLNQQGIKQATDILDPSKQDYRWISLEQLTQQEQVTLKRTEKIHHKLGIEQPIEVRIYEGLYDWQGQEVKSELGMYQASNFVTDNHTPYIGIKRSELATKKQFDPTYIAQLGHHVTGITKKYDRDYTEYFVKTLADKLREKP